jgi:hypothetical protein
MATSIQVFDGDRYHDVQVEFELETSEGWWVFDRINGTRLFLSFHWDDDHCRMYSAKPGSKLTELKGDFRHNMKSHHEIVRQGLEMSANLSWQVPMEKIRESPTCHAILDNSRKLVAQEKALDRHRPDFDQTKSKYCWVPKTNGQLRLIENPWVVAQPFLIDQIIFATQQANKIPPRTCEWTVETTLPTTTPSVQPAPRRTTNSLGYIARH